MTGGPRPARTRSPRVKAELAGILLGLALGITLLVLLNHSVATRNYRNVWITAGCFAVPGAGFEIWSLVEHRRRYGTWFRRPDRVYRSLRKNQRWPR